MDSYTSRCFTDVKHFLAKYLGERIEEATTKITYNNGTVKHYLGKQIEKSTLKLEYANEYTRVYLFNEIRKCAIWIILANVLISLLMKVL